MDIGSLLLILALLLLVGMFIARPLVNRESAVRSPESDQVDHELSSLLAERDRILTALQELDFDHALGKIPEEDYPVQRALLVQQGAEVYRQLDRLEITEAGDDMEARIEAAIAARRRLTAMPGLVQGRGRMPVLEAEGATAVGGGSNLSAADDELEVLLADRRRTRPDKSAGFCPQCGRPVQKSDRFCPKCGKALS